MITVVLLTALVLYVLPTWAELGMLNVGCSAWIGIVIGDLPGTVVLFGCGFRKTAIAVYLCATLAESWLLFSGGLSPRSVLFATNTIPTMSAIVLFLAAEPRQQSFQ